MRIVRHCLNLLTHFHKMYPRTLKNWTSENETKKEKNPRLRDLSVKKFETLRRKKTCKNETSRPLKNAFEI